jgi:hypothetical protein
MHTLSTVRPARATRLRSGADSDSDGANAHSDGANAHSDGANANSDDASCAVRDCNSRPCGCAAFAHACEVENVCPSLAVRMR